MEIENDSNIVDFKNRLDIIKGLELIFVVLKKRRFLSGAF